MFKFAALALLVASFTSLPVLADEYTSMGVLVAANEPMPAASVVAGISDAVQAAPSLDVGQFSLLVMQVVMGVKGSVPVGLKIAGIVLLLISLTKVSFLRPLWDKLGAAKAVLAPVLGLVVGFLIFQASNPMTFAAVVGYLLSGGGAIMLHEILDAVKSLPMVGPVFKSVIEAIQKLLRAPQAKPVVAAVK